ncbi:ABC transporter substrate-binding protein [Kineococcus rubinsiae]|uniref:ABC transporter substrate-binding protein n=1 Tax=Kineococcus rubinsiae TaxID=2609562 RepID=UPI0027E5697D|nr:ABC transporter substrate-binding protein [Kineococcus rubinsiae]
MDASSPRSRRQVLTALAGAGSFALLAACSAPPSSTPSESSGSAGAATSAEEAGGMDALVKAAKAEGQLNVIALPPDWANYGEMISAFTAKYGIKVNSATPDGSSQDEINAVNQLKGTSRAPDVLDIGMSVALANTALFAPYKTAGWADIPEAQKEPSGLWVQDYGGYMSVGYDSSKFPEVKDVSDLTGAAFKNSVALNGDPTQANAALNGVVMASLANGGSLDDISKGVEFFKGLKGSGNFIPVQATSATVKSGETPVVFDWDYLAAANAKEVPTWKVFVPPNATLGGYYAQAINKQAPNPAAARLWQEFLYSDEGQNTWLKGGARPVRMDAMTAAGTIDATAAAALPPVTGTPVFLSEAQATTAKTALASTWAGAIG